MGREVEAFDLLKKNEKAVETLYRQSKVEKCLNSSDVIDTYYDKSMNQENTHKHLQHTMHEKSIVNNINQAIKIFEKISILFGCQISAYFLNKKMQKLEFALINKQGKVPISLLLLESSIHILYNKDLCIFRYPYLFDTTISQDTGLPLPKWVLFSHSNKYTLSQDFLHNIKKNNVKDEKLALIRKLAKVIVLTKGIFNAKGHSSTFIKETMKEYKLKLEKLAAESIIKSNEDKKGLAKIKDSFAGIYNSKKIPNGKLNEACFPKIKIFESQENIENSTEAIPPTIDRDSFPAKVSTPSKKKLAQLPKTYGSGNVSGFTKKEGLRQTTPGKNTGFADAQAECNISVAPTNDEWGSSPLNRRPATDERVGLNSLFQQKSERAHTYYDEKSLPSIKSSKSSYVVNKITPSEMKATSDAHWVNTCVICEKKFVFKKYLVLPCNHQIHSKCMAL
jgi:hypothetical protein